MWIEDSAEEMVSPQSYHACRNDTDDVSMIAVMLLRATQMDLVLLL